VARRWRALFGGLGVLLVVAAGVQASINWQASSTVQVGVAPPPVQLEPAAGANKTHYFSPGLTVNANGTTLTGTLLAHAGADARVKDAFKVASRSSSAQSVTLSGTQVSSARVELFTWSVYNGTTLVGALDMRAASPSLSFTLPAGETWSVHLRLDVADGAGNDNSPSSFDLRLVVS
jgi:hypothetical protein